MGLGTQEILIILVVILIIFGAKKLPEIGGGLGKAIRNFKRATTEPDEIDITAKADKRTETVNASQTNSSTQTKA